MTVKITKDGYTIELEETADGLVRCPKDHRPAWRPFLTRRTGKNPENCYYYFELRHRKDGRTGKNKHCYIKAQKTVK